MADKIHFTKMQGAGNDYIYVDTSLYTVSDPVKAAIEWSDRHKGIGADGLVLIGRSEIPEADYTMRIFNADGSEARMCGNASRCIGKYIYEKKTHPYPPCLGRGNYQETEIRLLTLSGVKALILKIVDGKVEKVTVDMGEPVFEDETLFNSAKEKSLTTSLLSGGIEGGVFVSMGNPHYVIFVDDIQAVDVAEEGRRLEFHEAFPERCNIEFAQVTAPNIIRTRVWERGSGITMACGTGACATAVAAARTGRCDRKSSILMDGGQLDIEWRADNHVLLSGPAEFVFEGEIYESEE
jgi:diaminopimelate epimerase